MHFRKLTTRFKQFGGLRLLREYARIGALGPGVKAFFRCLFKRQSFKQIYPVVLRKVEPFLEAKYYPVLQERKKFYEGQELSHNRSNIVWFCWLQGLDNAPEIVRICHASIKNNLQDREIKLIDASNWRKYVELPDYIIEKWNKKQISPANFSDLLRLQLLLKYGGSWIDSTVLCTGKEHTAEYLDADLFLFQYTRHGSTEFGGIGNWFITSCTNNPVLLVLRDMLFAYWKDYNCTLDYYIFHLFFSMLAKEYPSQIEAMPYGYAVRHLALMRHWNEAFSQEKWDKLVSQVSFHKLSFRVPEALAKDKTNYYHQVLELGNGIVNCR